MSVKIMILSDELKTSFGIFFKGAIIEIPKDSEELQKAALSGIIEYCNPSQVGLFD